MTASPLVIDANILLKLLHFEDDSTTANDLMTHCARYGVPIFVPSLFMYEIGQVSIALGGNLKSCFFLFDKLADSILTVVEPEREVWELAEEIANYGHPKSGYPTLFDSQYHALAMSLGARFVTGDKKHYAKARKFGHVVLLKDWMTIT